MSVDPTDYVDAEETEDVSEGDLTYAELRMGQVTLMWHADDGWASDRPTWVLKTALYDRREDDEFDSFFKQTWNLSPKEAELTLENYGPWDYVE